MPSRLHFLTSGGAAGLLLTAALVQPQPAGACDCAMGGATLALADVELVESVRDLDDDEVADMERGESLLWPQEAWLTSLGSFSGTGGLELSFEEAK